MNIVHVIDKLTMGGAQVVVKSIVENDYRDNELWVYPLRRTDNEIQIQARIVQQTRNSKFNISNIFKLKRFIRNNDIQIVHLHLTNSLMIGLLISLFFNSRKEVKFVYHEHGTILNAVERGSLFMFIYKNLLKCSGKIFDGFIAISGVVQSSLKRYVPIDKIKLLYNPIDTKRFSNKEKEFRGASFRSENNIGNDKFLIGFAGRLIPRKGWSLFLKVAEQLIEEKDSVFLIAGVGDDFDQINDYIKTNKLDNVKLLGFVSNIESFYSALDLLIVPSINVEPMGLTYLEAMSIGIPVIATNVPAFNEIITDKSNGLLFNNKDDKSLLKKVRLIRSNNSLRDRLSRKAVASAKEFSISSYNYKLNEYYLSLLDTN
ncbi:MAG: Glycosyl transferase, group 1 [candidate division WS6 bacterium 34_10]|uniref:Glycosyl transferase, group 1 n=1 Tax=candidate division WS6 bacterium 34_10 TaxID=1641389 RepID=A0A117M0N2_9BACT|nr:MAG: Glycosyl transferase, group 1 [candidate division WS6 bacterium 34_10]